MLSAVVRAGDDGTAAAAGPGVQSGALHLEGAPGGLHHATRLHRGGMIDFQTEHGPHAVTLTTETLEEGHDPRLTATAATAPDLLFGALLQLDLAATDHTDPDRVPQIAQIVAMTDMAQARITGSAPLSESERSSSPPPSHRAQTPARASRRPALARAALTSVLDHVRPFHGPQLA